MQIDVDRIGELIGPGGKNIRAIQEKSGATITVDDSGTITISTSSAEASDMAKGLIEDQFAEAEVGESYTGTVKRITDFGAFIEFMPGKQGLCHISKISHERVGKVSDVLSENQEIRVKVLDVDEARPNQSFHQGRRRLSSQPETFTLKSGGQVILDNLPFRKSAYIGVYLPIGSRFRSSLGIWLQPFSGTHAV